MGLHLSSHHLLASNSGWLVQGDGITTLLDTEEETGTGMVKAVLKVSYFTCSFRR